MVRAITGHRYHLDKREYLVHWEGCAWGETTWVVRSDLEDVDSAGRRTINAKMEAYEMALARGHAVKLAEMTRNMQVPQASPLSGIADLRILVLCNGTGSVGTAWHKWGERYVRFVLLVLSIRPFLEQNTFLIVALLTR